MYLRETLFGVDWIHMDQNRDRWCVPVNTVMKFKVPQQTWNLTVLLA